MRHALLLSFFLFGVVVPVARAVGSPECFSGPKGLVCTVPVPPMKEPVVFSNNCAWNRKDLNCWLNDGQKSLIPSREFRDIRLLTSNRDHLSCAVEAGHLTCWQVSITGGALGSVTSQKLTVLPTPEMRDVRETVLVDDTACAAHSAGLSCWVFRRGQIDDLASLEFVEPVHAVTFSGSQLFFQSGGFFTSAVYKQATPATLRESATEATISIGAAEAVRETLVRCAIVRGKPLCLTQGREVFLPSGSQDHNVFLLEGKVGTIHQNHYTGVAETGRRTLYCWTNVPCFPEHIYEEAGFARPWFPRSVRMWKVGDSLTFNVSLFESDWRDDLRKEDGRIQFVVSEIGEDSVRVRVTNTFSSHGVYSDRIPGALTFSPDDTKSLFQKLPILKCPTRTSFPMVGENEVSTPSGTLPVIELKRVWYQDENTSGEMSVSFSPQAAALDSLVQFKFACARRERDSERARLYDFSKTMTWKLESFTRGQ